MKEENKILVTKASGELTEFSGDKLRSSMLRAGATQQQADEIIKGVSSQLYQGIPTKKIYSLAFRLLRGGSRNVAAKYHLKRAIMELGPSGYPFEKFVAEILKHQGYAIRTSQVVQGHCVTHEIDVIAEKGEQHFMVECKYHNQPGTICDVKIPLYIQARFKDVEAEWIKLPDHAGKVHQGWVVTNTRFSGDAIQYGTCAGLRLLGWNYPNGKSLRSQIDALGLYPVTCLISLTKSEKQKLLNKKIVLCKEISSDINVLINAGINSARINLIFKEASELCNHLTTEKKI